ncbi:MAG: T9SS type A sorting domain-containing protein [Flavobacteriaceae bacterium]|nr:T9SS type A sorting domain-containing protein [Flavobacteriaceae bacterium]
MKTKLFLFNPLIWVCLIMGLTTQAQNPFCEDFNQYSVTSPVGTLCDAVCNPSLLNNWGGFNIQGINYTDVGSQGGAGDYFLYLDDGGCSNGGTFTYNDTDFNGNWLAMVPQEEGCFCFDMRAFHVQTGTITGYNTLRIYDGPDLCSSTLSATFVISTPIDVAAGWQRVCAPIALSSGGVLPSNSDGQWVVNTGNAADWDSLVMNVNSISFYVDVDGGDERWGIDNICISEECDATIGQDEPTDDGAYCCTDEKSNNLITNGNFEFGDTGFTSAYSQSTSTYPGEYDVTTSAAAFGANVTDQSFCADPTTYAANDMFMVVNGKTQQSGSSVIWEQTIQGLEEGKEYKFCANFKDMEQCTFNIYPNITLSVGGQIVNQVIDTDDTNPCDWERIEICFTAQDSTMNLQIALDETGNGDGNDLAIDDISLQEKLDPDYFITIQHQGNNNDIVGSLNTISNTDDILLNEACVENGYDDYYWFVYETSLPANPPANWNITPNTFAWSSNANWFAEPLATPIVGPWGLTTNFPDYPFAQDTFYVIGMWIPSCCESCYTESWEYQITYNNGFAPQNDFELTDKMKAKIKSKFVIGNGETTKIGSNSESQNNLMKLFPNPAQDNFSVKLLEDTIKSIEIFSVSGQKVFIDATLKGSKEELVNISSLTSGMYFVNVVGENQKKYTAKLVKE